MLFSIISTAAAAGKSEEPIFECPLGWEFHGDLCRRRSETALVPYCGDSGTLLGSKCVTTTKPYGNCNKGDLKGLECSSIDVAPPVSTCPAGYEMVLNGKDKEHVGCEKVVPVPGPGVCPKGTIEEGKNCAKYQYVEPKWYCPPGEYLDGLFCVREEPYDCTFPVIRDVKKTGHGTHLRPNGKKTEHYPDSGVQVVPEPLHVGKGRRLGEKVGNVVDSDYVYSETHEVERWCIRKGYTMAVAQCPEKSLNDGKRCQVKSYFEKEAVAPVMTFFDAPVDTQCPVGYDWCQAKNIKVEDSDKDKASSKYMKKFEHVDLCCKEHLEEPYYMCPDGYDKMPDGQCARTFEPVMICPEAKKDDKKKNSCLTWEYMEPNVILKVEAGNKKKKDHHGHH